MDLRGSIYSKKPNSRESLLYATQYDLSYEGYIEFCRVVAEMEDSARPEDQCESINSIAAIGDRPLRMFSKDISSGSKNVRVSPRREKPQDSYAYMIYRALDNSQSGKLTLAEIYSWIEDEYPFYKTADSVWKNSIRHNLSLNSVFKKIPRPESSKGKGGYWAIDYSNQKKRKIMQQKGGLRPASPTIPVRALHGQNPGKLII